MNKRMMATVFLACAVAVSMTGCKNFFSKKTNKDNLTDVTPGNVIDGPGVNGTGGTRIEGTGTIVDAQLIAIQFAFDSAQVDDSERAKVETAAKYLKDNAGTVVTLEGHCDERGSAEYNMSLGERRAQSVRTYLMDNGVDSARIQTKSFGAEKAKDPGHDEKAWAVNRRVEFVVMKQ